MAPDVDVERPGQDAQPEGQQALADGKGRGHSDLGLRCCLGGLWGRLGALGLGLGAGLGLGLGRGESRRDVDHRVGGGGVLDTAVDELVQDVGKSLGGQGENLFSSS